MTTNAQAISLNFHDKQVLYASYMPSIKNGGIFIPTNKTYQMNDEVEVIIKLPDETEKLLIIGRVVWLTPKAAQGNRPTGIGVQFISENATTVRDKIEGHLAGLLNSDKPTYTL